MSGPRPWVGSQFGKLAFRPSVLIVGDSHYGTSEEEGQLDLTERVVQARRDRLEHPSFFSVVEQIIVGRKLLVHEVSKVWDELAFLNYAPRLVTDGKSASPTHFAGAATRLKNIVADLEPDVICFFSATAWAIRPWGGPDWDEEVFGSEPIASSDSLTMYPFKNTKIVAARFNHPRALGAPMDVWHSWYREVIRVSEDVRAGRR